MTSGCSHNACCLQTGNIAKLQHMLDSELRPGAVRHSDVRAKHSVQAHAALQSDLNKGVIGGKMVQPKKFGCQRCHQAPEASKGQSRHDRGGKQ